MSLRCNRCGKDGPQLEDTCIGFKHHCGGTWQPALTPPSPEQRIRDQLASEAYAQFTRADIAAVLAELEAARRGKEALARVHAKLKEASDLFATLRMEPHFSTAEFDELVALAAADAT